jgi:ethanolamine utilization microcompartment shell protein EutS
MIIKIDKAVDGGKQEQLVKVQEKKSGSRAPRMYYRKQKKNVEEAKGDKEQKIQPMVVKIKEKITDIWDNMGQITNVVLDKAAERIKTIKTKKIQSRTMGYAGIIAKDLAMKASLVSIGALNNYADSAALSGR